MEHLKKNVRLMIIHWHHHRGAGQYCTDSSNNFAAYSFYTQQLAIMVLRI